MAKLLFKFYKFFYNRSVLPRWLIFILDIHICAFALFFAYWLRFNMDIPTVVERGFLTQIVVVSGLNMLFFRIFHTYKGIIRLSGIQESIRCVWAVFWSFFILFISLGVSKALGLPHFIPTSVLLIYFFAASFLLIAYRVFLKGLYHKSLKGKIVSENVLIYGHTVSRPLMKSAIESMGNSQYKVIGFIDETKNLQGKSIDDARFYSFEQSLLIFAKYNVTTCFITADDADTSMKKKIVDHCLAHNVKIKVIPIVQKWLHGHLETNQLKNLNIESLLGRPGINLAPDHLRKFLKGKIVMVTGAAGSIGGEIVKQLLNIEIEKLIICDNRETGLYDLEFQLHKLIIKKRVEICISDVRNRDVMHNIFSVHRPQVVFHAAAYKHVPLMEQHPCEAVRNNVLGTKIVADLSVKFGVERFVLISSDKAINPTNVMGATKRLAEMYIGRLQFNQHRVQKAEAAGIREQPTTSEIQIKERTKFIITRFGNVLGSNGSVIPVFQKQIEQGGPVTITHPDIIRFFMTIPEACSLVLEACTMGKGGEVFVFDMGEPVKIIDLATKMILLAGFIPGNEIKLEYTGLRPGEKLYEEVINKTEEVMQTHHEKIMISKVNKFEIDNIDIGIEKLLELANQNNNLQVVKQMKLIVKEYKSKNSIYEHLDEISPKTTIPDFSAV